MDAPLAASHHSACCCSSTTAMMMVEKDDEPFRYEGAEKTLEVHFLGAEGSIRTLRSLPRRVWDEILDHACCRILSKSSTEHVDAYVLSESSLFVYDWRLYLKTCGRTTLLKCLPPLFKAAEELLGSKAEWLRFSHKNFCFPEDQKFPHGSFEQETQFCMDFCSSTLSSAHVLGDILSDHWNVLYVDQRATSRCQREKCNENGHEVVRSCSDSSICTSRSESPSNSAADALMAIPLCMSPGLSSASTISTSSLASISSDEDEKDRRKENIVNIMMYDMDREVANHFYPFENEEQATAALRATRESGIESLFANEKDIVFDSYMFTPCGYSLNVLIRGEFYATIHVTPEPAFSYVSFETNMPTKSYEVLLRKVLNVFRPSKCTVALFSDCKHQECLILRDSSGRNDLIYRRVSHGSARIQNVFFAEMSSFSRVQPNNGNGFRQSSDPTTGEA